MDVRPLRLEPGSDLRSALEKVAEEHAPAAAFVVSGIGSLVDAKLRFAGEPAESLVSGPLELLTIGGSLTTSGAHLHVAVSDRDGNVIGGHLGYGSLIRTTAEILLVILPGWSLSREYDLHTGFNEWVVRVAGQSET